MAQKQKSEEALTPEEVVAQALNEQGYLFHHKVIQVLRPSSGTKHEWFVEASEVPVSLPNGNETRVDIVLRHCPNQPENPWRVVMECKRAARDYKRWVFFADAKHANGPSPGSYYTEHARLAGSWDGQGEPVMSHFTEPVTASSECPVFDFGVETRINRDKKSSATEAIEDSFRQVTLGQAGLAFKLRRACALTIHLIPVVVTTAELMSAHFDTDKVSLDRGTIDPKDLTLASRKWLAVNYRISDVVSQFSGFTGNRTTSIAEQLVSRQVRTVFVTQAEHLQPFLEWLEKYFPCALQR